MPRGIYTRTKEHKHNISKGMRKSIDNLAPLKKLIESDELYNEPVIEELYTPTVVKRSNIYYNTGVC